MKVRYYSRKELQEESPSRRDNISAEQETKFRRSYCSLINDAGIKLKVPQWAIATAYVFCHRFFAVKSMAKNDRFTIASACLHLACKVEESPRPLDAVVEVTWKLRYRNNPEMLAKLSQDKALRQQVKDQYLMAERAVLYCLGFDLTIVHPYTAALFTVRELQLHTPPHKEFTQVIWNFLNDSLRTLVPLQEKPEDIACSMIMLAAKITKRELPLMPNGLNIMQHVGCSDESSRSIMLQVMDQYDSAGQKKAKGGKGAKGKRSAKKAAAEGEAPPAKRLKPAVPQPQTPDGNDVKPATAEGEQLGGGAAAAPAPAAHRTGGEGEPTTSGQPPVAA